MDIQLISSVTKQKRFVPEIYRKDESPPFLSELTESAADGDANQAKGGDYSAGIGLRSASASWRRFASDTATTSYEEERSLIAFYERLDACWRDGMYEEVLEGIDRILDAHLPGLEGIVRSFWVTIKSKCYEQMGEMHLALIEAEKAVLVARQHETFIHQLQQVLEQELDLINYLETRKAGLMLHNGKKEEAFAILRENQPTTISGVLIFHLLERECKVSLLKPASISDEEDLMSLFLAGRYEDVIEKTNAIQPDTYSSFFFDSSAVRLRAAALVMAGRIEEALALYKKMRSECTFSEDGEIYSLIQILNGECVYPFSEMSLEKECDCGFPVSLFTKWIVSL